MSTVKPTSTSVNDPAGTSDAPDPSEATETPEDLALIARNKAVEAHAMASVVAEAVCALSPEVIEERVQALAVMCERTCEEALAAMDLLMKKSTPAT